MSRRFQNIACYVLVLAALLVVCMMVLTSCSPKTVSVTTRITEKKDSTNSTSEILKDSSFRIESFEEKILPAATVGITLNKKQLDSLIAALGNLPSSVPRTVYYQDPKLRAMLSIMIDSLGQYRFLCTALEQLLQQKTIDQGRFVEKQKEEKNTVSESETVSTETIKVKKPGFFEQFKSFTAFLVIFIVIVLAVGLWAKFKPRLK